MWSKKITNHQNISSQMLCTFPAKCVSLLAGGKNFTVYVDILLHCFVVLLGLLLVLIKRQQKLCCVKCSLDNYTTDCTFRAFDQDHHYHQCLPFPLNFIACCIGAIIQTRLSVGLTGATAKVIQYLIDDTPKEPETSECELRPLQKLESCVLSAVKNHNGDVSCEQKF